MFNKDIVILESSNDHTSKSIHDYIEKLQEEISTQE